MAYGNLSQKIANKGTCWKVDNNDSTSWKKINDG